MNKFAVGEEVVRTKGDYVVGRTGRIVTVDLERERAQVAWHGENKTWVSFKSLELTSVPYKIIKEMGKYPRYQSLAIVA